MKKLTGKILAIAAAFAFASVFASCSFLDESDDSILSYFDPSALSAVNNGGSGNSGSGSSGSGSNGASPVTYVWSFSNIDLTSVSWTAKDASVSGTDADASDGIVAKVYPATDLAYASTPSGLTLTIGRGSQNGSYNKINKNQSANTPGSAGAIEPSKTDMISLSIAGPFTATMIVGANGNSDKTDRTANISINGAPEASISTVPATPTTMTYNYTGTDSVTVSFGGSNAVRIYDIQITK